MVNTECSISRTSIKPSQIPSRSNCFFLVGAAKSGTTWLQLVLDGHPEITCRGEGHFTQFLAPSLENAVKDYNNMINTKNRTIFKELEGFPLLGHDHLLFFLASAIGFQMAQYSPASSIRVVGEKSPGSVRALSLLRELFPKAKFLHIIRDGRDVAVSAWFHNLRVSPDETRKKFGTLSRFTRMTATTWMGDVKAGHQFGQAHPTQYAEVKYEDLQKDTPGQVRRILDFLDVTAEERIITDCCEAGAFDKLSGGRAQGEEGRDSHFRKGSVGDWRNHFDDQTTEFFERQAGDFLRQLGYS
jgi:hypothetical protein